MPPSPPATRHRTIIRSRSRQLGGHHTAEGRTWVATSLEGCQSTYVGYSTTSRWTLRRRLRISPCCARPTHNACEFQAWFCVQLVEILAAA
eukprot:16629-Eustigmatos_ZCMA.PRE.1